MITDFGEKSSENIKLTGHSIVELSESLVTQITRMTRIFRYLSSETDSGPGGFQKIEWLCQTDRAILFLVAGKLINRRTWQAHPVL